MHQKKQEVLTSSQDPLLAIPNHSEPDAKKVTRTKRRKHQQTTNNDSVVRNGGAAAAAAAAMVILVRSCPTLANVHGSTSTETFLVSWFSPPLFPNTRFYVP
jgi:hypothetical protein